MRPYIRNSRRGKLSSKRFEERDPFRYPNPGPMPDDRKSGRNFSFRKKGGREAKGIKKLENYKKKKGRDMVRKGRNLIIFVIGGGVWGGGGGKGKRHTFCRLFWREY